MQVREEVYPLLGCSGCAAVAKTAIELLPLCAAAQDSEMACLAADGVIAAPAPAPAMAPAPEPLEDVVAPVAVMRAPVPVPEPEPQPDAAPDPTGPPEQGPPAAPPVVSEDDEDIVLENGVAGGIRGIGLVWLWLAFGLVLAV